MRGQSISYMLVCASYPPVLGGSEVEAQRVSNELRKRGHRPRIVCAGGPPMPPLAEWVDPFGIPVKIYGGKLRGRWRDVAYALGVAWSLLRERKDYQVVYFLMQGLQLAAGVPVARLLGKPIVMKFSGSGIIAEMRKSWAGRMELCFLRWWADRVLVLNPGMREEAKQAGLNEHRLGWMPNPVDTEYFRPASTERRRKLRRQLKVPEEAPVVVFVGRIAPEKKLPCLVRAFAGVRQQRPDALLVMIGEGPLRTEIETLAAGLELARNVIFTGRLNPEGVLDWLQAADTFALISEVEGLPCSLIEAMSAGLAPVVSGIPAHLQLVDHEVHGLIAELGSEESTARALLRILDSAELRQRMGAEARRRMIQEFDTPKVASRYEALFGECLTREIRRK